MSINRTEDYLDSLLAQSAQVSDRGFTQRVLSKIETASAYRLKVFISIGVCWICLALALLSPAQLYQQMNTLLQLLKGVLGNLSMIRVLEPSNTAPMSESLMTLAAVTICSIALLSLMRINRT